MRRCADRSLQVRSRFGLEVLVYNVRGMNPAAHTRMVTSSVDVEEVGPERLDGVGTVHYKGTYDVPSGASALRPPRP